MTNEQVDQDRIREIADRPLEPRGARGWIMPPAPDLASWGLSGQPSEQEMRGIRDRAVSHAAYISPEMGAFDDEDAAYFERFFKTAQRIADWIKDGA